MSDGAFLVIFTVATALSSAALSKLLTRRNSRAWSRRRIVVVSALPLPAILGLLSFWVFAKGWLALLFFSKSCGVDACAMAIMFSSIGLFWTVVMYGVALFCAAAASAPRRRKR